MLLLDSHRLNSFLVGKLSWTCLRLYFNEGSCICLNSCLIARNLLNGMKTCAEVSYYMNCSENKQSCRAGDGANSQAEVSSMVNYNDAVSNSCLFFWLRGNLLSNQEVNTYSGVFSVNTHSWNVLFRVMNYGQDRDLYGGEVEFDDWNILGSPPVIIRLGNGLLRGRINHVVNITHVAVNLFVESSVLAFLMEPAVKNTVGKFFHLSFRSHMSTYNMATKLSLSHHRFFS